MEEGGAWRIAFRVEKESGARGRGLWRFKPVSRVGEISKEVVEV